MEMLATAGDALLIMLEIERLGYLFAGVLIGLALGVIPGLGGIVGMALLLPFTFDMDSYSAFAFLLGMGSVTTTSDTIPAVLFGVPGTAGSAATVLDGHPLAKQGQAGRAFGAAYSASLAGGVFGALMLGVSVPILRPMMQEIGSPELLAFAVFGLCMVSALSGGTPLRGLIAAGFGLMVAAIGQDPQVGVTRFTYGWLYLWDGLSIIPITLGLFALPELADMAVARRSIAGDATVDTKSGQWQGVKDTAKNWFLVLRAGMIGAGLGSVPGMGSAVIDWIAYGHAATTEKGALETFGTGDIRGVLASEGSNNAKEGGALVPTIAFGVPGSAQMAILLGAFLIQGLVPGPDMLTTNLEVTYSMVWSVALANILGAGVCFLFSNQFARVSQVRHAIILPLILAVLFVGAFQGRRDWGDLLVLVVFGVIGWVMKRMGWPRPPVILGVVLGGIIERYLWISYKGSEARTGFGGDWLSNWLVLVLFAVALVVLALPLIRDVRDDGGIRTLFGRFEKPRVDTNTALYVFFIALFAFALTQSTGWRYEARFVPQVVGWTALVLAIVSLANHTFRRPSTGGRTAGIRERMLAQAQSDIATGESGETDPAVVRRRILAFAGWLAAFIVLTFTIGMLPTIFVFAFAFMTVEGERPMLALIVAASLAVFCWFVFDDLLALPWPDSLLGDLAPALKEAVPGI
jgi:TctA family transporter